MNEVKGTILVVDDEESIRIIISRKLQAEGYSCVTAADSEEALEAVAAQDFDLVLLDTMLPGLSGTEVLSRMTTDCPDMPVVILTWIPDKRAADEAIELGAYDSISKPFDSDDLTVRLQKALQRRRLILGQHT